MVLRRVELDGDALAVGVGDWCDADDADADHFGSFEDWAVGGVERECESVALVGDACGVDDERGAGGGDVDCFRGGVHRVGAASCFAGDFGGDAVVASAFGRVHVFAPWNGWVM